MGHEIGWGLMLVFVGGMLNGSFAAPMKRLSAWRWENIWLLYSLMGLLILPWIIALATVPHVGGVLQQSSAGALAKVVLQGAHARLAHRGIWALNEKRMVQWANLTDLYGRFASLGSSEEELSVAFHDVRASVAEIETEVLGRL